MRVLRYVPVGTGKQLLEDIKELVKTYDLLEGRSKSGRVVIISSEGGRVDLDEKFFRNKRYDIIARGIELIREKIPLAYEFALEWDHPWLQPQAPPAEQPRRAGMYGWAECGYAIINPGLVDLPDGVCYLADKDGNKTHVVEKQDGQVIRITPYVVES